MHTEVTSDRESVHGEGAALHFCDWDITFAQGLKAGMSDLCNLHTTKSVYRFHREACALRIWRMCVLSKPNVRHVNIRKGWI